MILKLVHPEFYRIHEREYAIKDGINVVVKSKLIGNWYEAPTFRYLDKLFNFDQSRNITKDLSMGMRWYWAPCAVFLIRPPCAIGYKVEDIDVLS